MAKALEGVDFEAFEGAVAMESRRRMDAFLTGVERYRNADYQRSLEDPPIVWSEGSTRFLDYSGTGDGNGGAPAPGRCVLLVPSLINRGYILDLSQECSFARWLAAQGFRPVLVEWGAPGAEERDFDLASYIARLERGFEAIHTSSPLAARPAVLGYCMGGLLALALAIRRRDEVGRLALLAMPWDFHAPDAGPAARLSDFIQGYEPFLATFGELPVDVIQMLFFMLDPFSGVQKFSAFASAAPDAAARFIALEDWLNDGAPLTAGVARECLRGWYG
ncbi:MAG: alpha/beta hydrolase, partial [Alphaproteobacteria bacterium]|nr:alpha/beta hydrolase [Alphaproteobacteria bacterium]